MDAGHESISTARSSLTSIVMEDNAGERNPTLILIPLGSSTIASRRSRGSGNLGLFPAGIIIIKCIKCLCVDGAFRRAAYMIRKMCVFRQEF